MKILPKSPQESLDKNLIRFRPKVADFLRFKAAFDELVSKINEAEREENQKTHISNFLRDGFYKAAHEINTKGDIDLAIHLGPGGADRVGVIVETKSPKNRAEMITAAKPNTKAMQELVLYFMRERIDAGNDDLKYLIATNITEWFIFNASDFEQLFNTSEFRKSYLDWRDNKKVSSNTSHFYNEIAKPHIDLIERTVECAHFSTQDAGSGQRKLTALYKLLSPYFLLKERPAEDSNKLDRKFYTELLHIIGLEEYKEKSKTKIRRKENRDEGSLLEKAAAKLESEYHLFGEAIEKYGETKEERIFNAALELCIVWINRILFLKLLEAQLVGYHDDTLFRFLNTQKVNNFNELWNLFHEVLNRPIRDRKANARERYPNVPYLNSSLFDTAEVETDTIRVNALDDNGELEILSSSVLKKSAEARDRLPTLEYLFRFLDAYDFASEGKADIQSENRTLINASVLGKVFEKINGYRDGSIYTPGFITMYMCRQAIRLAVVQKFKDETDFDGADFDELKNWLGSPYKKDDILRHNALIDSLKVCDPAVGSGHFLVSALNEILAIKSELGIFADSDGNRFGNFELAVADDELVITDRENNPFEYKMRNGRPLNAEMQRLQKALFHEKQKIIENCLFGVDINPNSVKICRLRLWIELLKNAYYKEAETRPVGSVFLHPDTEEDTLATARVSAYYAQLETLPNIDINIKRGNSLVSRYKLLDTFQSEAARRVIREYRDFVTESKHASGRERKEELRRLIRNRQNVLSGSLEDETTKTRDALTKKHARLSEINHPKLFEKTSEAEREMMSRKIQKEIDKLEADLAKIERKYDDAFEWRFEYPEVLDDDGNFLGFDVVIGNPPYINAIELKKSLSEQTYAYLKANYSTAKGAVDLFVYFFECGIKLIKDEALLAYITPNRYLSANYAEALREFLLNETRLDEIIDYSHVRVFAEASTYPVATRLTKTKEEVDLYNLIVGKYDADRETMDLKAENSSKLTFLPSYIWGYLLNDKLPVTEKVIAQSVPITESGLINATSTASEADLYHDLINEEKGSKLINTGTIDRYESLWGRVSLTDKGNRYLRPLLLTDSDIVSPNRRHLYSSKKIMFAKIALATEAFYDEAGEYASINTNCLHSFKNGFDPKFVLGWLNSKLFQYTFECFFEALKMQGGYLSYSSPYISKMYIKGISSQRQSPFIELVSRILEIKELGESTVDIETRLDEMFFDLYELTGDERRLIRKSVG